MNAAEMMRDSLDRLPRKKRRELQRQLRKYKVREGDHCPKCLGKVVVEGPGNEDGCVIDACLKCGATWERDKRAAGEVDPCDNCAFRPGSPEQLDKPGWRKIVDETVRKHGAFYCHKRVPLDLSEVGVKDFQYTLDEKGRPTNAAQCMGWLRAKLTYIYKAGAEQDG